jgi:phosphohistidine phosphatase SixA
MSTSPPDAWSRASPTILSQPEPRNPRGPGPDWLGSTTPVQSPCQAHALVDAGEHPHPPVGPGPGHGGIGAPALVGPVVYLVRHAHAGPKARWQGPDLVRPLSAQGRREALGLIQRLSSFPLGRVLSSPAVRCRQTVQPLAARRGRPVEENEALGVDGSGAAVAELLVDPALEEAVLCTHGEQIGEVFGELQRVGLELSDPPRWPKGCTWILRRHAGQRWKGTYLAPLAVEPVQHPLPP